MTLCLLPISSFSCLSSLLHPPHPPHPSLYPPQGLFPLSALCEVALSIPASPDPFLSHPSFQLPRLSLVQQQWVGLTSGNSSSGESTGEDAILVDDSRASANGDLGDVSSDARLSEEDEEGQQSYRLLREDSLKYRRRLYLELSYGWVCSANVAVMGWQAATRVHLS